MIKKEAAAKLGNLKAHAGLPSQGPGWAGEWFAFHMVWAYFWNFNVQNKVLPGLVSEVMGKGCNGRNRFAPRTRADTHRPLPKRPCPKRSHLLALWLSARPLLTGHPYIS